VKSLELEVRTPLLDNDILDFMRELPSHYHFGKRFYRAMMRQMFPDVLSEMARRSNLPDLDAILHTANLRDLICQINLKTDSPLGEYFDRDALRELHESYFAGTKRTGGSRRMIKKAGKALARWPAIHRLSYKLYLPMQKRQDHDFISESRILLRLLTLNLYFQRVFGIEHEFASKMDHIQCA
jgi:hypothetical protein